MSGALNNGRTDQQLQRDVELLRERLRETEDALRKAVTEARQARRTERPRERRAAPARPERTTRIARIAAVVVMGIAALTLVGWLFDVTLFKSVLANMVSMKPNTALGLMLAGAACLAATFDRGRQRLASWRYGSATVAAVIGAATMCEWVFGFDLGIDQALFREIALETGTVYPGRPAPWTALNLSFFGVALLLLDDPKEWRRSISQTFAILGCLSPLVSFLGYLWESPSCTAWDSRRI